jgi:hypothetical protein
MIVLSINVTFSFLSSRVLGMLSAAKRKLLSIFYSSGIYSFLDLELEDRGKYSSSSSRLEFM